MENDGRGVSLGLEIPAVATDPARMTHGRQGFECQIGGFFPEEGCYVSRQPVKLIINMRFGISSISP